MSQIKIKNEEIIIDLIGYTLDFPKYTTQLMNLANQNAQGTRPKIVGQLSELIQEFQGKTYEEWKSWYKNKHPNAIEDATKKIDEMITNLRNAILLIDKEMTSKWVEDLVIAKTFSGFRFQKSILKKISEINKTTYRLATPIEESKGIDGFIDDKPISIKPFSYKTKNMLNESIEIPIIYYEKKKDGIEINFSEFK